MNLDEIPQMNKTQMNMYSTLAPVGRSLVRQEFPTASRSSRYRYTHSTKPYNPQTTNLSCAISKQYQTQTKIAVLPNLKREKGFMLEQWLNDALQGQQGMGIKQPLKTLKKYQMDKGSLKNANLSNEQINNLYNGLFVYTSGIKNTFEQMLKGASSQNRNDNRLEKTYWKIFIKLLQNTIPVKTCFQIIQDNYRREITVLKNDLIQQHNKELKIQEDYQQKIKRLKRDIQQSNKKFSQYEQQYKVMNANLIMYEQTFNEQVSLRLKFEQKINQVYTSYGELKERYQAVRVELNYKTNQLVEAMSRASELQTKIADQFIKNQDVIKRLRNAQQKILEKDEEIIIKIQQISDIRVESQTEEQRKKSEEIALDQLISTIKLLKKRQAEHEKKVNQLRGVIEVQQNTINKLKETLSISREKNDEMYTKYRESIVKNTQIEQSKAKQLFQLETTKSKTIMAENKLSILKAEKQELSSRLSKLQLQIQFKDKEILDKNKTIEIFNENIAQLKSTKDRYERLNSHLRIQLQKNKDQIGNKTNQLNKQMEKVFDLSYQLQKQRKANADNVITINILKSTIQSKDADIKDIGLVFKNKLNQMQMKIKQKQLEINDKNKQISSLKQQMGKKDAQKLNKFEQLTFLHKHNTQLIKQTKQHKEKVSQLLKQQQSSSIQAASLKKKLQSKQFTLDKKRDETNSQIINLRESLLKYKIIFENRRQYVHPMILQDYASRIGKYQEKIKQIHHRYHHNNSIHDSLLDQLQKVKQEKQQLIEEKVKLSQSYQILMKDLAKRQEQKKNLRNQLQAKIKEKEQEIISMKDERNVKQETYQKKLNQKIHKIQQLTEFNQKQAAQIKRFQQIEAKRRNCKDIGIQLIQINKIDVVIQTEATVPQSIANNAPNLKKKTTSLRQSQHSLQRQERGLQKPSQRLYDKIVDHRQVESIMRNNRQIISQQQREDNQKRQQKAQRKIQGKQFKKALRMTLIRK